MYANISGKLTAPLLMLVINWVFPVYAVTRIHIFRELDWFLFENPELD
jgi:hypothetical protein